MICFSVRITVSGSLLWRNKTGLCPANQCIGALPCLHLPPAALPELQSPIGTLPEVHFPDWAELPASHVPVATLPFWHFPPYAVPPDRHCCPGEPPVVHCALTLEPVLHILAAESWAWAVEVQRSKICGGS
jgi:hypothetical protein